MTFVGNLENLYYIRYKNWWFSSGYAKISFFSEIYTSCKKRH